MNIHPTAIIETGAELGEGTEIGAYAFVGADVVLGAGCRLHHHATVDGNTTLGARCEVFPYACVGLKTQDLKYRGGKPGLRVGDGTVFREFCTIHTATFDGEFTVIGDHGYFLAYSHVAHDCQIGNHVIVSNNGTLAGHVHLGDRVVIGGMAGVHQFCRIGAYVMVGGCSKVEKDVPPYLICDGQPAVVRGLNRIGLQRANFDDAAISRIKNAYRTFYREGLNRSQAAERLRASPEAASVEVRAFLAFSEASERGFAPGLRRGPGD